MQLHGIDAKSLLENMRCSHCISKKKRCKEHYLNVLRCSKRWEKYRHNKEITYKNYILWSEAAKKALRTHIEHDLVFAYTYLSVFFVNVFLYARKL